MPLLITNKVIRVKTKLTKYCCKACTKAFSLQEVWFDITIAEAYANAVNKGAKYTNSNPCSLLGLTIKITPKNPMKITINLNPPITSFKNILDNF